MTFDRDTFITLLSKHAGFPEPDYTVDSAATGRADHTANRQDNAGYLKGIFSNANQVEKNQGSQVKQLFPGGKEKETSSPLMKLANMDSFFDELLKLP